MIAILDNIRSLHNVGSIFRTADAVGIEKVYLCGITPEPEDRFGKIRPQFKKVSLGAEKSITWEHHKSTARIIDKLKSEGHKIFAVEQAKNSIAYYKIRGIGRRSRRSGIALVFGNEVKGLSKIILNKVDKVLEIPMRGEKESLNVSVAFGVVVFQLLYND